MRGLAVAYSRGKVRIGAIAFISVVAFAIPAFIFFSASPRAYSGPPAPTLFVTDACSDAVTAYPATSNGDIPTLAPAPTGLSQPKFVAFDASGNIYVTNECDSTVTVYANGSKADVAPTAIIGGSNTGLFAPEGIALDSSGKIYVANGGGIGVRVYPALGSSTGTLNEAPIATISGIDTGLSGPIGIALDSGGKIYVANNGGVYVYAALGSSTGTLNEAPIATIGGSNTGMVEPADVAVDSSGKIYVTDNYASSVFIYSAGSDGDVAPIASISGTNTALNGPIGIALDSGGEIYVTDIASVYVYAAPGSNTGTLDEAPIATIGGSNTGLSTPYGVAIDSGGKICVVDFSGPSVLVYPTLGSSTGVLNEAPSTAIGTNITTGLIVRPGGIAVDSSGKIYVADPYAGSLFVYAAGSNGNAAPIATISGSNTGLSAPLGPDTIALDSSGNIYVTASVFGTGIESVFVYAALGSSTGMLDEAPIATIGGSNTGLTSPQGIALDSNGNIYVADFGGPSVLVYSAKSDGNIAPIATISGANTGLIGPAGIAVDSSDKIYVADMSAASVLVYPALGSSTGPLDEFPIATISGNNTALTVPIGIALDSGGEIYVSSIAIPNLSFADAGGVLVYPALGSSSGVLDEFPSATIGGPLTELNLVGSLAIGPGSDGSTPTATPTATATATGSTPTATATATVSATPTATPTSLPIGDSPAISRSSIAFGNKVTVGSISKAETVTIKNKGKKKSGVPVNIQMEIAAPSMFVVKSECEKILAPGKSCKASVTFKPTDTTEQSGSLMIYDNVTGSPQTVTLSGTGAAAK